jgi:hypothetical protein
MASNILAIIVILGGYHITRNDKADLRSIVVLELEVDKLALSSFIVELGSWSDIEHVG